MFPLGTWSTLDRQIQTRYDSEMKKTIILLLIGLLIAPLSLMADHQETSDQTKEKKEEKPKKKRNVIGNFWSDHAKILTCPVRIKAKDLLIIVPVGIISGIMILNDEIIYEKIKDFQAKNAFIDKSSPFFSNMCQGLPFGVAGLFILDGLVFKNDKALQTGSMALQAMMHSFVVVQLAKHLTGRTRPSFTKGIDHWAGPGGFFKRYDEGQWAYYDAYFSGHTITIWALATVIAKSYNKTPYIPILCYTLATLGGMATVTQDLHWVSDVFLAAVVGYAIATFVMKQHEKRRIKVMPIINSDQMGISLSIRF